MALFIDDFPSTCRALAERVQRLLCICDRVRVVLFQLIHEVHKAIFD
jgi:hypothetical protein